MLTQARLKILLDYDQATGIFRWKKSKRGIAAGTIAGRSKNDRYKEICINGKMYLNHRLAWLYVYGYFPENEIDHIDKIRHHNWISNLREVTRQCNARNTDNGIRNTSGIKGVHWCKIRKKWYAQITINQIVKNLGRYDDFDEAVCVRLSAEQCVGWSGCDSSSPAYQYVIRNIVRK